MVNPEKSHIPSWAERERGVDMAWIRENLFVFWPLARQTFEDVGRGAIVVDTTTRPTGEGHPFGYFSQELLEGYGNEDTQRMVREYDPTWELVTVLLKSRERISTYRIGVPSVKDE